jgi:hypothetical protein
MVSKFMGRERAEWSLEDCIGEAVTKVIGESVSYKGQFYRLVD